MWKKKKFFFEVKGTLNSPCWFVHWIRSVCSPLSNNSRRNCHKVILESVVASTDCGLLDDCSILLLISFGVDLSLSQLSWVRLAAVTVTDCSATGNVITGGFPSISIFWSKFIACEVVDGLRIELLRLLLLLLLATPLENVRLPGPAWL